MPNLNINHSQIESIRTKLRAANIDFANTHPGVSHKRQPIHSFYGGAQLYQWDAIKKISENALQCMKDFAATPADLANALSDHENLALWEKVHARVLHKLKTEAVEDLRIDFEDGYGNRPDAEEDAHAESTALDAAKGMKENLLPPFIGIRIKPFNEELITRSLRTIDIFISTLVKATNGKLPSGFIVTLPKITILEQSEMMRDALENLEKNLGLPNLSLKYEIMVETPQSVINKNGIMPLRSFVEAGKGRCIAVHFGTYDYTAGSNITAHEQRMDNPVCDFAKHVMQVTLSGLPIFISDGATNIMPIGSRDVVHRAWKISYNHINHSLVSGFYQGWDLHPNQLPIRYATLYAFFLRGLAPATARLKTFIEKAAKATLLGDVFDDAATGQGLLNFFLRGMSCGAITKEEALSTGLTIQEIESRSFLKILEGRKIINIKR